MPKYLLQASYSAEGAKGVIRDGGSKRRAAVSEMAASVGAKLEGLYFTFGDEDVYVIVDAPDNASVAAVSLAVNASGAVRLKTSVILTPEEMDAAAKKAPSYRPPGH